MPSLMAWQAGEYSRRKRGATPSGTALCETVTERMASSHWHRKEGGTSSTVVLRPKGWSPFGKGRSL